MPALKPTHTHASQQIDRTVTTWANIRYALFKSFLGGPFRRGQTAHPSPHHTHLPPTILNDYEETTKICDLAPDSWHAQTVILRIPPNQRLISNNANGNICVFEGKIRELEVTLENMWGLRVPLWECEYACSSETENKDIDCGLVGNHLVASGKLDRPNTVDRDISDDEITILVTKTSICERLLPVRLHFPHRRAIANTTDEPTPSGIPADPISPVAGGVPTAAIAGGVVAGVLVIIALFSLGVVWRRRQKLKNQGQVDTHEGKPDETELGLVVAAFGDSVQFVSTEERLEEEKKAGGPGVQGKASGLSGEDNVRTIPEEDRASGVAGEEDNLGWKHGGEMTELVEGYNGGESVGGESRNMAERDSLSWVQGDEMGRSVEGDSIHGVIKEGNIGRTQGDQIIRVPLSAERVQTDLNYESDEIQPVRD